MSNSKADALIVKIAKIIHGPSCGAVNCADCKYHDLPSVYPENDKCPDYYSAVKLVKQGCVDDVVAEFLTGYITYTQKH